MSKMQKRTLIFLLVLLTVSFPSSKRMICAAKFDAPISKKRTCFGAAGGAGAPTKTNPIRHHDVIREKCEYLLWQPKPQTRPAEYIHTPEQLKNEQRVTFGAAPFDDVILTSSDVSNEMLHIDASELRRDKQRRTLF